MRKILLFAAVLILALIAFLFYRTAPVIKEQIETENLNPEFSDVAPVIHKNCTPCHQKDQVAHFSLITYSEIKNKAKQIRFVTENKLMPPWPADPEYTHFAGEKVLSQLELNTLNSWIKNGCPAGDTSKINYTKSSAEYSSVFGKPDLIIKAEKAFQIEGNNKDHFMVMKIPYEIPYDTFVRAIEFVPDNKRLLHHMNGHLLQFDFNKKKNVFEGESAVNQEEFDALEIHKKLGILHDDGSYPSMTPSVSNFLPGTEAVKYPDGIGGFRLSKKGAMYLNDMHFGPSDRNDSDQSFFRVYFSKDAPERPLSEFQLGTLGVSPVEPPLIIPAGKISTYHTETKITKDLSILSIVPHMHLLGKSFHAYAIDPKGDTIRLIKINKWDFRWQYAYTFKKILKIPAGSVIHAWGTFDNTLQNPFNPNVPPKIVAERNGSMRTSDEMFQLIITYLPYQSGDENISLELAP